VTYSVAKEEKKLTRSIKLLKKYLDPKDAETFLSGNPFNLIINHELYTLHKINESTVEIRQEGRATPGYIRQGDLSDLYDSVVAFIQNVKYAGVDWGCGNMALKLPDTMPPRNTSFKTYIYGSLLRGSEFYKALRAILFIISRVLIFPACIGYYLLAEVNSTLDFIIGTSVSAFLCIGASAIISFISIKEGVPLGLEAFYWITFYLLSLGYGGAIYGRYNKWKSTWEVKTN
jgi:hypothetical protein